FQWLVAPAFHQDSETVTSSVVVVDDEHRLPRSRHLKHCLHRQGHAKSCAAAVTVSILIDQSAAVRFDDQLTERQTDAAATDFACLAELEDLRAPFRWHAGTAVADLDDHFIGVFMSAHVNLTAVGLRFHSVTQEVIKSLPQSRGISFARPGSGREFCRQVDLFACTS